MGGVCIYALCVGVVCDGEEGDPGNRLAVGGCIHSYVSRKGDLYHSLSCIFYIESVCLSTINDKAELLLLY